MVTKELLDKAIRDFPIGTEYISCFGNKNIIKNIPYIDGDSILVHGYSEDYDDYTRYLYHKDKWVTIISKSEIKKLIINNFEIW